MSDEKFPGWHGTTIIGVKKNGLVVIAGDGQVSLGQTVIKGTARKVRRLSPGGFDVVAGFAGSTADAFTLLERLEAKLEATPGQLARASVELAKDWRTDKYLQKLEAMLIVTDGKDITACQIISGDAAQVDSSAFTDGDLCAIHPARLQAPDARLPALGMQSDSGLNAKRPPKKRARHDGPRPWQAEHAINGQEGGGGADDRRQI